MCEAALLYTVAVNSRRRKKKTFILCFLNWENFNEWWGHVCFSTHRVMFQRGEKLCAIPTEGLQKKKHPHHVSMTYWMSCYYWWASQYREQPTVPLEFFTELHFLSLSYDFDSVQKNITHTFSLTISFKTPYTSRLRIVSRQNTPPLNTKLWLHLKN